MAVVVSFTRRVAAVGAVTARAVGNVRWLSAASLEPPKRPVPAYAKFVKETYPDAAGRHPEGTPQTEIMRSIAADWKQLADPEKERFVQAYQQEKDAYESSVKVFLSKGGDEAALRRKSRSSKPPRDPSKPKRPISAWSLFVRDQMAERSESEDVKDVMSSAAGKWAEMPQPAKAKYDAEAAKDRERYDSEMAAWVEKRDKQKSVIQAKIAAVDSRLEQRADEVKTLLAELKKHPEETTLADKVASLRSEMREDRKQSKALGEELRAIG